MHNINPLKTQLKPILHLLALLGAHHILHVSRIRVKNPIPDYLRRPVTAVKVEGNAAVNILRATGPKLRNRNSTG